MKKAISLAGISILLAFSGCSLIPTRPSTTSALFQNVDELMSAGRTNAAVARLKWALDKKTFSNDSPAIFTRYIVISAMNGDINSSTSAVSQCRQKLQEPEYLQVFSRATSLLLNRITREDFSRILEGIEKCAPGIASAQELALNSRLSILSIDKDWKASEALFKSAVASVSDNCAVSMIATLIPSLTANAKADTADSLCSLVLSSRKPGESSFFQAAGYWLDFVRKADSAGQILPRLDKLQQSGLPADKLFSLANGSFYIVLTSNNANDLKSLADMINGLRDSLTTKQDRRQAARLMMDFHFEKNDFDSALRLLETYDPDESEKVWTETSIAKLKAHKALQDGDNREAVAFFREFTNSVAKQNHAEVDPVSGMFYPANWCLARNAARIGDILASIDQAEEAQLAYREAKGYFDKAIVEAKAESKEHKAISSEIQTLADKIK